MEEPSVNSLNNNMNMETSQILNGMDSLFYLGKLHPLVSNIWVKAIDCDDGY